MKLFPVWLLAFVLAGCASTTLTNLTPTTQPRNPTGQYLVEMQIDSQQQTLIDASITPYVYIGYDSYKMVRTPKMKNRWETYIPVPTDKNSVIYHFKVLYEYQQFGKRGEGSRSAGDYKLTITDK